MKTPKRVSYADYIADCTTINQSQWDDYMQDTTKANGSVIRAHIKEHLPELYSQLCLGFRNPYENQSRKKDGFFVYVHSAIEYFIAFR